MFGRELPRDGEQKRLLGTPRFSLFHFAFFALGVAVGFSLAH
jgi:hypothetical protein